MSISTKPVVFLIILFISFSCKKDKLKDDKEIFIGKWSWVYSKANLDLCSGFPKYDDTLTPTTENTTYQIEFIKKGKVFFYKDQVLIAEHRIVFNVFGPPYTCNELGYTFYAINLDNDNGTDVMTGLEGCISSDTLQVGRGFPYYDDGCNFYTNYFVKG